MNDRERISRLIGAAVGECASSKFVEVRSLLVRALKMLGEVEERRERGVGEGRHASFAGMTRAQRDNALRAIEEMIDSEKTKIDSEEVKMDLFG